MAIHEQGLKREPIELVKWWPSAPRSSMAVVASQVSRPAFILRRLRSYLMRCSVVKAGAVRGVAWPILRFRHLHRRPFPEGWWRLTSRTEKLQDIYTKIRLWGENGVPRRSRSSFVAKVSQRSSASYRVCQIHSGNPPMSFASSSVLTRIWCAVQVACETSPAGKIIARRMLPKAARRSWPGIPAI